MTPRSRIDRRSVRRGSSLRAAEIVVSSARWALAALALAVALLSPGPVMAQFEFDKAQAKINWIDVSEAPVIKIHVSFLDRLLRPVPLKMVHKIEVLRAPEGRGRPAPVKSFVDLLPEDGGDGEVLLSSKADEVRDVVIVAVGHQGPALLDGDLGVHQKSSIGLFFKKLGAKDRVNVVWYNDRLFTYVFRKGKKSELSDLADTIDYCHEAALKRYQKWGEEPEPPAEGEEPAPADPCGLVEDYGRFDKILKGMPYRGFFPRLLGIDELGVCIPPRHDPVSHGGPGARQKAPPLGGAIDEAMKMLVQKGVLDRPKYLIVLSDGKNGYLEVQEDCRLKYKDELRKSLQTYRDSCRQEGRGRAFRSCLRRIEYNKKNAQLKKGLETKLQQRLTAEQERFRDQRLGKWLALARAARINVFAVGYPTGLPHELERLELLSMRSGGTYREAGEASGLGDQFSNLLDELANQYVIVFDAGLEAKETASFAVKLQIPGVGTVSTQAYAVYVPEVKGGVVYLLKTKFRWLERKVGSPWHIVITVLIVILVLLFIYLFIKLIIGLVKKIFKKGAKKAKGAAKAGLKGAAKR